MGIGPVEAEGIDVVGDGIARVLHPFTVARDLSDEAERLRRDVATQALTFRDHRDDFLAPYRDQIIALAAGQVVAAHPTMSDFGARGTIDTVNGQRRGLFLKGVVPLTAEREHLALYEPIANGPAYTSA
jgi:hypothetical protein